MFDLKLNPHHSLLKFDHLLPVFNWYYPFPYEADEAVDPALMLSQVRASDARRRALYFHMPFCDTICTFCPFYRAGYQHHSSQVERYLDAMAREIAWKASYAGIGGSPVDVIAVGGGTPSVLSEDQILNFGALLRTYFDLSRLKEFTFEVEVKSVTPAKIAAMQAIGVNRISFGAQTFDPRYRDLFNLTATVDQVRQVSAWLTEAFPYVNADIIYGMPGQSLDELLSDTEMALQLGTTTVDFYLLNNMAASVKLHRSARDAGLQSLPATTRIAYRLFLDEYLRSRGYAPINGYSYARDPGPSRQLLLSTPTFLYHDIVYGYADEEVIGFGSGSFTYLRGVKSYNLPERERYTAAFLEGGEAPVVAFRGGDCPEKGLVYFPYRGSLLKDRIDWDRIPRETAEACRQACDAGLMEDDGGRYVLSKAGWLFYVNLMYFLMPENGRQWLSTRIDQRIKEGREPDVTRLIAGL